MLTRLNSYLEARSGRAGRIVAALVVVIILMSAAMLYQWLDVGGMFDPPYPSEVTPLTLADDGIVWTASFDPSKSTNYTFMRWHWFKETAGSGFGFELPLANLTSQHMLSSGTQVSADVLYATITDILGDGEFNTGDKILFNGDPGSEFPVEGTIYRLALVYIGWTGEWEDEYFIGNFDNVYWGEYSCAVESGNFYSWRSNDLSAGFPWWYGDKWIYDPSPF